MSSMQTLSSPRVRFVKCVSVVRYQLVSYTVSYMQLQEEEVRGARTEDDDIVTMNVMWSDHVSRMKQHVTLMCI